MAVPLLIIRIDPGDSLLTLIQLNKIFPWNQAGVSPVYAILADLNPGRALLCLFAGIEGRALIPLLKRHCSITMGKVERAPTLVLRSPESLLLLFGKVEPVFQHLFPCSAEASELRRLK